MLDYLGAHTKQWAGTEALPLPVFVPGGIEWLNRSGSDLSVVVEMPEVI